MTTTKKMTAAQQKFMASVVAAGDAGFRSPDGGSRVAAAHCSAWHRTAAALKARGMIRVTNNGSTYRAFAQTTSTK
jgi:hypothetical protein